MATSSRQVPPRSSARMRGCSTPTSAEAWRRTRMSHPPSDPVPKAASAAANGAEPILVVDGLVAGYGGGDVLRGVSFTVQEGGITCIVGPNGAGKSTLLAVISGLLRPRLGSVRFRGEPVAGKTPRQILTMGVVHVHQRRSLSGGQQRLVEFARCLMLDLALIILDEPSMGRAPRVLKSVFDAGRLMNR